MEGGGEPVSRDINAGSTQHQGSPGLPGPPPVSGIATKIAPNTIIAQPAHPTRGGLGGAVVGRGSRWRQPGDQHQVTPDIQGDLQNWKVVLVLQTTL